MKATYSGLLMLLIVTACQSSDKPADGVVSIQGKWAQRHSHDDKTYHDFIAFFKSDGTYDGIENGKVVLAGGNYRQQGDTLTLNDASCAPYPVGQYRIIRYAGDSLRFELISDSCHNRREGTLPLRFKRIDH
ncbi:MAG: hypothetical protein QM781_03045 [Chitinophagaceae bacterium]